MGGTTTRDSNTCCFRPPFLAYFPHTHPLPFLILFLTRFIPLLPPSFSPFSPPPCPFFSPPLSPLPLPFSPPFQILHYLDTIIPEELFSQLLAVAFSSSLLLLLQAGPAAGMQAVREEGGEVERSIARLWQCMDDRE